jgi:hypothetical protein
MFLPISSSGGLCVSRMYHTIKYKHACMCTQSVSASKDCINMNTVHLQRPASMRVLVRSVWECNCTTKHCANKNTALFISTTNGYMHATCSYCSMLLLHTTESICVCACACSNVVVWVHTGQHSPVPQCHNMCSVVVLHACIIIWC